MKGMYHVLLVVAVTVISLKCQKELSGGNPVKLPGGQPASSPLISTLQGNILDENGQPSAGATITVGTKTATTNTRGYFRITDAELDNNVSTVIAEQPGYFKAYRSFSATTGVNQVVIKLIKKQLEGTVNSTAGGEVLLTNGAKVSLPAGSISTEAGGGYTGTVQVYAAYIDPTSADIGKTIPGSLMADDKHNMRVVLASYGMLAVELRSAEGLPLQLAPGKKATLTTPIPSSILSSAPVSIPLWYIDEQKGIWKEQGTAQKSGSNYVGEVSHFSYWNCDLPLPTVSFSATFKTAKGSPLKNIIVIIKPAGAALGGSAHGYTDSLGQAAGLIPSGMNLVLEIYDECDVIYTKNIGPFSDNADLGTIVIPSSLPSLVTINGTLLGCDNTPVPGGYAILYLNNMVSYLQADMQGKFSTNVIACRDITRSFEVIGVNAASLQQGNQLTIPVASPVTEIGNIIACGTSSSQFLNYNIDGTDYNIGKSAGDSLNAFAVPFGNSFYNYVQGYNGTENTLNFNFSGDAIPGIYPLISLSISLYREPIINKPFTVIITAYPQRMGDFYEGTFSGSFIDRSPAPVTHSITCSFRVRKN
ncbi:MAG: carboxypeptidase-like regulatory domain-containing protein [Ferruginibacter sp.]